MSFNKTKQIDILTLLKCQLVVTVSIICVMFGSEVFADEGFKYDAKGRRDPFIPLISESGGHASDAYEASAVEDIRLEGIVWDDVSGSIAIINGEIAKEGETIGSVKILKINKDNVIFDIGGESVKINLNEVEKN